MRMVISLPRYILPLRAYYLCSLVWLSIFPVYAHELSQQETLVMSSNQQKTNQILFTEKSELNNWIIINDTVMGGRSQANISLEEGYLLFKGDLSLENNGGFASTRRQDASVQWLADQVIQVTLIGDGRNYQFRLRTQKQQNDMAYVANFRTTAQELQTLAFTASDFTAQFRGQIVRDTPALSFANVAQLGFMLVDKTPGKFSLKVKEIYQTTEPKFK